MSLIQIGDTVEVSPRLHELTLRTSALATSADFPLVANPTGDTSVRVLLPDGYAQNAQARYPVLYLLHGGLDNHASWTTAPAQTESLTAGLPLIVVMPDGGAVGAYSNWYNGGAYGPPRWMDYHLEQLIPWIDEQYRTLADRSHRATAGFSMGGHAVNYAATRPDLIGATAQFSGGNDITQPENGWHGAGAFIGRLIWGDFQTDEVRWRATNATDLAKNLEHTDVTITTGDTGESESTFVLKGAIALSERLTTVGIPHRFSLFPGMGHTQETADRGLAEWLPGLMDYFDANAPTPTAFTYSSIAHRYSMYGWEVLMERPECEFSALHVVDAQHFAMIGSGHATVRMPTVFAPHTEFRVTLSSPSNPDLNASTLITTDGHGVLTVPVPLGPGNPYQQYTAAADDAATGPITDDLPFLAFNNGSHFVRADVIVSATSAESVFSVTNSPGTDSPETNSPE